MATKGKATAPKAAKRTAKAASRPAKGEYRVSNIYRSPRAVPISELPQQFSRADIEFIGVDHSGASYEARVFINQPNANENTPKTEADGYAGSYSIFGHGGCFGDVGHCEIHEQPDEFDPRPSHPLLPIRKVVVATDAIKRAVAAGTDISLTVVPVLMSWNEKCELEHVMKFDHINIVTYD